MIRTGTDWAWKSIRHIAAKYGGEATVEVEQNWFTLSVLLPRP